MAAITLYGTPTSPYARRVRVVALELGVDFDMVDTRDEDGQAQLRRVTPLWKVPVVETDDGAELLDSHAATEYLLRIYNRQSLRSYSSTSIRERSIITVIDGALDALVNVMYLGRDGVTCEQSAYLQKQRDRARTAMAWVEEQCSESGFDRGLGLAEIALVTTTEWMKFRGAYPYEEHPRIAKVTEHVGRRASFLATAPPKD